MTGNGKTDKKFHTLQHQISVVFICLLLLSIFTITLINGLFLEKYYNPEQQQVHPNHQYEPQSHTTQ